MNRPELDKMKAVREQKHSQEIGDFIEWLHSNGMTIATWQGDDEDDDSSGWWPIRMSIEQLLANYFGIDLNKVDAEKQNIIDELRARQGD